MQRLTKSVSVDLLMVEQNRVVHSQFACVHRVVSLSSRLTYFVSSAIYIGMLARDIFATHSQHEPVTLDLKVTKDMIRHYVIPAVTPDDDDDDDDDDQYCTCGATQEAVSAAY